MKKRISKRISVLLAIIMVISMLIALPIFASAASPLLYTYTVDDFTENTSYNYKITVQTGQPGRVFYRAFTADKPAPSAADVRANGASITTRTNVYHSVFVNLTFIFGTDYVMYFVAENEDGELSDVFSRPFVTPDEFVPFPLDDTFALNSKPDSNYTIYLDFDGHVTPGGYGWSDPGEPIVTPAFDLVMGDPDSFNKTELLRIQRVWQRVAEAYSPFDVNVTTQEPPLDKLVKTNTQDNEYGIRCVIGGSSYDWSNNGAGGVAFVGSFNSDRDVPCFVFPKEISYAEKTIAAAAIHEVGHTLGLHHDGIIFPDGSIGEYYIGDGEWGPIMGTGYSSGLVQWSRGEYEGATNTEDDLQIISTYIPYRADDHGNTPQTATPLAGTPLRQSGIIEKNTDVDVFSFTLPLKSDITLNVDTAPRGATLDTLVKIRGTAPDKAIVLDNPDSLNATYTGTLPAGTYSISVEGTGKPGVYSDYASLGQYTVTVDVGGHIYPADPEEPSTPSKGAFCDFWQRIVAWFQTIFNSLFGWI